LTRRGDRFRSRSAYWLRFVHVRRFRDLLQPLSHVVDDRRLDGGVTLEPHNRVRRECTQQRPVTVTSADGWLVGAGTV
jgi:hypothetical protein